jgi:hypothetical protein
MASKRSKPEARQKKARAAPTRAAPTKAGKPPAKPDQAEARQRADNALVERRLTDLLRIRLDGAERWDICDYVRAKEGEEGSPWHVGKGATPLSESQIWRYLQKADEEIERTFERSRKRLLRRHVAKLNHLYGRATTSGELSVARVILKDLAEVQRLLPSPADLLQRALDELTRRMDQLEKNDGTHPANLPEGGNPGDRGAAGCDPASPNRGPGDARHGTARAPAV